MKTILLFLSTALAALAYPPAPHHELYGLVKDEQGSPISTGATVAFYKTVADGLGGFTQGQLIISGNTSGNLAPGTNYSVKIPMDANIFGELYTEEALITSGTFTVSVVIGGEAYVPLEVSNSSVVIGEPAGRTRLDLTLGVDSDGDGLPDSWEQTLISQVDGLNDLQDVTPDGDADHDGVSNYVEYIAGTYAFTGLARFGIDIIDITDGVAHMRFLGATGRSYQLKSSEDLAEFNLEEFSISADTSEDNLFSSYVAETISYVDIYVPLSDVKKKMFVLCVQ